MVGLDRVSPWTVGVRRGRVDEYEHVIVVLVVVVVPVLPVRPLVVTTLLLE